MTQQSFAQVHKQAQVQKQAAGGILQRKCDKVPREGEEFAALGFRPGSGHIAAHRARGAAFAGAAAGQGSTDLHKAAPLS